MEKALINEIIVGILRLVSFYWLPLHCWLDSSYQTIRAWWHWHGSTQYGLIGAHCQPVSVSLSMGKSQVKISTYKPVTNSYFGKIWHYDQFLLNHKVTI